MTRQRPCVILNTTVNAFGRSIIDQLPATFHKWGIVAHATTMSTAAVVEMDDGTVRMIDPTKIRFIKQ